MASLIADRLPLCKTYGGQGMAGMPYQCLRGYPETELAKTHTLFDN